MVDIYENYYCLVDCYAKGAIPSDMNKDSDEVFIFKLNCPIDIPLLMNYLGLIIGNMYKKLETKEKVMEEIEKIKKSLTNNDYKWNKFSLKNMFENDYNYLISTDLLKPDLVPNITYFIEKYSHPEIKDLLYPFTIKQLFNILLNRAINICINNYYLKINKKKNEFF